MIGSPDLLAFTGTEGFGEGEEDREGLPEELSVPRLPPSNPWTSAALFHRDFILVAEFSEQVGPRPVLTIPDVPGVIGSFDLNHFSVRIMSVDYQASGPCQAAPGPRLNFSEDSKVVLGDSAEDAFAYVHHVTLYDLEARGLVRPFCMAYVCSDQEKLTENFCELSSGFAKASESLKTGNRQAFSAELQRRLQELEYTRSTLLQEAEAPMAPGGFAKEGEKADELDAVERSISQHQDLLRQVTSYPNRKLKQPDFLPYDPADSLADPAALLAPARCPPPSTSTSFSSSCRSERRLKPLEELCNDYFLTLMKEQLADAERRLRGDKSVLRINRVTRAMARRITLTNFLFELWRPEDGDEEEEEVEEGRESAEAELQRATSREMVALQSDPTGPESFCSCVEEIPIMLEAGRAGRATPDPPIAPEMTGSTSSGDSIEVLGTERSYQTQRGSDSRAAADSAVRSARTYARRADSEDSIEVLSTTEIFPDDLTAITEEEAEPRPLSNGSERKEEAERARGADGVLGEEETAGADTSANEASNEGQEDGRPEKTSKLLQVPDLHVHFSAPVAEAEADRPPPPGAPLRLLSIDEGSDCASVAGSHDPPSDPRSDQRRRRRRKAGLRALRFLKQNSFSQHAVFCLLSGRPLVVAGGDESAVRKLVEALSLFLPAPGPDGAAVMPCLTAPLQLSDLLTWRLIGIHRSPSGSSAGALGSLTRYLALLDLDQRTLLAPSYSGCLVGRLADPRGGISRGGTYLLHLESCLTALANRALLHAFRLPSSGPGAAEAGGVSERDVPPAPATCSSEHDSRVMRFLCDLITRRHAGRGPPALSISYNSVHLHRNTHAA
uniref:Smith-Magenis syndrome chromosome region, candidate 8b n=1 Tax=Gasterosteus aculeatus aculeatus TaxID=481459 RepID=A0AAQ4R1I0_GASAC